MRIGIDARMMGPQCGGIGRYIEQLIKYLLLIDTKNEYVLFLRKEQFNAISYQLSAISCILADIPWYGWEEQTKFKKIIDQEKVDLMHFPHWNVPLLYNKPFVVTIHDLIMWHYPREEASTHGPLVYALKNTASHLVVRHAARAAKHILTTSEFTKQDIHTTLGVPLTKMSVTYQAPFGVQSSEPIVHSDILKRYGITKPYVLYVGTAYPHKNLERLCQAWDKVNEKLERKYQLVLVGKESFFYNKLKNNGTMEQWNNVIFAGFVPDDELEILYTNALLYAAPSLYEGFALPALEAMARGIPVAASNRTCFPEVLGEAAVYFDPENIAQMADTISRVLTYQDLRFELVQKGKEEVEKYSWERLARETLAVYDRVKNP